MQQTLQYMNCINTGSPLLAWLYKTGFVPMWLFLCEIMIQHCLTILLNCSHQYPQINPQIRRGAIDQIYMVVVVLACELQWGPARKKQCQHNLSCYKQQQISVSNLLWEMWTYYAWTLCIVQINWFLACDYLMRWQVLHPGTGYLLLSF